MPPGPAAPAQKPAAAAGARQATQAGGKAQTNAKEEELAVQRLLKQAELIEQRRQVLRLAGMDPHKEPARPAVHWDFVLKEMRWMAVDFTEERHWKRAVARAIAHEISITNQRSMLKQTSLLDDELESAQSRETEYAEMLKARLESGKSASTCARDDAGIDEGSIFAGIDMDGDLAPSTPLNSESCIFTYAANEKVSEFLEDYLNQTAEANIIAHELDIRDYELDYEAAKKAAASAAAEAEKEEERRIKMLEKNPLGDFMPEDEEMLNIASKPRRVKKPHHLDEFESGFDDELEPSGLPRRSTIDRKRRLGPAMETREVKQPRREFPEGALPRKSATKYDSTGKRVNKPARISSTPSNRFDGQQVRPHTANAMPWSSMEDSLLCAVVHEFGPNFAFAAEILKSCCALSGVCRRALQCKERFKQLTAPADGQITPESALAQQITKGQAREIMQKYMPVPEATVRNHCSVLVNIGSKHKQMLMQERAREQEKVQQNPGSHASQLTVYQAAISKTANRNLNAMEMIEWAANKHKREQMRQQQLEQQQAQALEAQRVQAAQQAALGGPPAAMGPPAMPSQPAPMPQVNTTMANGSMQPPGYQGQSMGPPSHQSPAMMGGDPTVMPGGPGAVRPPMGVAPPGGGSPAMNPAMQTFNGPVPPGVNPNVSTAASQAQLCAQKMQQYLPQIQKLQTMLNQGKTQQGQPLTDEQRQTVTQQLGVVTSHYKRLQLNYQQLRGMNPQEVQQRQQQMQMQQQRQQQGMQPMAQPQAPAMRPAGYNFPAGMSAQRPNMGMQQNGMAMPQGPMSPGMPAIGNMPPPQMNGMAMAMPPNGMMNQQGMHGHMLGQQAQAPGLAGMMPQNGSQPMQGVQQNLMRPQMAMQQLPKQT